MQMKVMVNLRQKAKWAVEENVAKTSWTKEVPKASVWINSRGKMLISLQKLLTHSMMHSSDWARGQVSVQLVLPEFETFRVVRLIGSISNEEIDWGFDLGFYAIAYIVSFLCALDC